VLIPRNFAVHPNGCSNLNTMNPNRFAAMDRIDAVISNINRIAATLFPYGDESAAAAIIGRRR
jgi:hypothetical protein